MAKRIFKRENSTSKPEMCPWQPLDEFEIDYSYNLCVKGCDGKNFDCKYHPLYDSKRRNKNPLLSIDFYV